MIEVAVVVQVLGLDVENDGVFGMVERECAVALIALSHHQLALVRPMCIGAEDGNFRTHIVAGLDAGFAQQVRGHG